MEAWLRWVLCCLLVASATSQEVTSAPTTTAAPCTSTVTVPTPNGMEGSFQAGPGYWLNFGWHFTASTQSAYAITWMNPTASFLYSCTKNGPVNAYTLTYQDITYTNTDLTANDEHAAWQTGFAAQLPGLCGDGAPIYSTNAGANFTATVCSNTAMSIQTQFHYRVPGAIGGTVGNVQLATWCPANTNNGQYGSTCGASWSATLANTLQACPTCTSAPPASTTPAPSTPAPAPTEAPSSSCPTQVVTILPPNGMEPSFQASPGDWINFGWYFVPSISGPFSMSWLHPLGVFIYSCANDSSSPQTFNVSFPSTTYTNANYPGSDARTGWQNGFSAQLPALCGTNAPIYSTTYGGSFGATVCSTVAMNVIAYYHYRVPTDLAGGGGNNVQLASWCPNNLNTEQYSYVCGAPWSQGSSVSLQPCPSCSSSTNAGERLRSVPWMWLLSIFLLFLL